MNIPLFKNKSKALWLALIFLFLLSGVLGHDPWWRKGEAYSFGIIYHFFKTGTWLVPMNADAPFMEKPPLYYWSAVLLCRWLGGILSLPDAARLTSVFYMLIAVTFMWKLSQVLFAEHPEQKSLGWISLMLLLGSYGAVLDTHDLVTDIALLAGTIVAFYGIALLFAYPGNWKGAGLWTGLGVGIAFLSKGLFMPAVLFFSSLTLWVVTPTLHTRRTLWFAIVALTAASPLLLIWPIMLYHRSPALFMEWFWENNIGRFIGFSVDKLGARNEGLYFLQITPQYTFPSLWLACAEIAKGWRQKRYKTTYLLPLILSFTGMSVLFLSASFRAIYLLPLLPGFAILGAQALVRIPYVFLIIWNRITGVIFILGTVAIWAVWWDLSYQIHWLPDLLKRWLPMDFVPHGSQMDTCLFALLITCLGLASLRLAADSPLYTARNWLAGMLLLWGLSHTLLLPWFNERKSHAPVMLRLIEFVQNSPYAKECLGTYQLDEDTSPMIRYFSGKSLPIQDYNSNACPLILSQVNEKAPVNVDPHWHLIWRESLIHYANEEFRLYEKNGN